MGVYVANRFVVGALAELWCGSEKNVQNLLYISIGTGIAVGVAIQAALSGDELQRGRTGACHRRAGRSAMRLRQSRPSASARLRPGDRQPGARRSTPRPRQPVAGPGGWTPRAHYSRDRLSRAAEEGDEVARQVVVETATYLGIAVANLINLFNPALIVLGGSVGQNGDVLLAPLRDELQRRAMAYPLSAATIVTSTGRMPAPSAPRAWSCSTPASYSSRTTKRLRVNACLGPSAYFFHSSAKMPITSRSS